MKAILFGAAVAIGLVLATPTSAQHGNSEGHNNGHKSGHNETASSGGEHRSGRDHAHSSQGTTALLERLREGGLVLYFRHERTDMAQSSTGDMDTEDCLTQRNLSMAGIAGAREVGENLRELEVPVGPVLASPLCRTMDTARFMFGRAVAEPALFGMGKREREAVRADLLGLVAEHTGGQSNAVFVAHISNVQYGFDVILHEGDAAVLALEAGKPVLLGTIAANAWNDLVHDEIRHGSGAHAHGQRHKSGD